MHAFKSVWHHQQSHNDVVRLMLMIITWELNGWDAVTALNLLNDFPFFHFCGTVKHVRMSVMAQFYTAICCCCWSPFVLFNIINGYLEDLLYVTAAIIIKIRRGNDLLAASAVGRGRELRRIVFYLYYYMLFC